MVLPVLSNSVVDSYVPVGILILIAITLAAGILVVSHLLGPRRTGPVKQSPYESGMPIIGDARRRFNVKFYIVAILFLLFDVEVVLMWPWAVLFNKAATEPDHPVTRALLGDHGKGFLLLAMVVFLALLIVGYVYEWRKGVFKWS